jgi:formamidopyrimidine-DNA glycosylase
MPELPDVTVYVEHVERRVRGTRLLSARVSGPNLLRTFDPPLEAVTGAGATGARRVGKRIAIEFEDGLFLVIHLMIAGRLHWFDAPRPPKGRPLAALAFERGTLTLTEAGTKHRASLHLVRGESALRALDPGGLEVLEAAPDRFAERLRAGDHTLKRALTDPRHFSGIGNAYSDEILHRAKLSPLRRTSQLHEDEVARLLEATRAVLLEWTDRLRAEAGEEFPEGVTAFREGMAVHGRYRKPCPVCGAPVQRIRYADRETNYCARCQTGGRLLADRGLSRLLKGDWPRTLEELEGA